MFHRRQSTAHLDKLQTSFSLVTCDKADNQTYLYQKIESPITTKASVKEAFVDILGLNLESDPLFLGVFYRPHSCLERH